MEQQKKSVFISYSRKDYKLENGEIIPGNIVSEIKSILEENNIGYWLDEEGISATTPDYMEKISRAIDDAPIFLFIATENSCHSRFCKMEVSYAVEQEKTMIIVKNLEKFPSGFGIWLAGREFIDHLHKPELTAERLIEAIAPIIQPEEEDFKKTFDTLQTQKEQLLGQLKIYTEYRAVLQEEIDAKTEQLEQLQAEMATLEEALRKRKESISAVVREVDRLNIELDKINSSLAECKGSEENSDVIPVVGPVIPQAPEEETKQTEKGTATPAPAPEPEEAVEEEPTPTPPIIPTLTRPQPETPTPAIEPQEEAAVEEEVEEEEPTVKVDTSAALSSLAGFFKPKKEEEEGE